MNAVALSLMFLAFVSIVVSVQPGRVKAASEMPMAGRGEFDAAGDPIRRCRSRMLPLTELRRWPPFPWSMRGKSSLRAGWR